MHILMFMTAVVTASALMFLSMLGLGSRRYFHYGFASVLVLLFVAAVAAAT